MITGVFVRGSKCEPTCNVTITVLCHGEFVNARGSYFKKERVYDPHKINIFTIIFLCDELERY
jgi:hypothetical protein